MRFAWLRKNTAQQVSQKQPTGNHLTLIRMAYNIAFWVFLLPFFATIEYGTGFLVFTIIILIRLSANLYTNNLMEQKPEYYESFPFRA